jgi:hypothetical protein
VLHSWPETPRREGWCGESSRARGTCNLSLFLSRMSLYIGPSSSKRIGEEEGRTRLGTDSTPNHVTPKIVCTAAPFAHGLKTIWPCRRVKIGDGRSHPRRASAWLVSASPPPIAIHVHPPPTFATPARSTPRRGKPEPSNGLTARLPVSTTLSQQRRRSVKAHLGGAGGTLP